LGIGDWGLGPIPNPQSPIPNYFFINSTYYVNIIIEIHIKYYLSNFSIY